MNRISRRWLFVVSVLIIVVCLFVWWLNNKTLLEPPPKLPVNPATVPHEADVESSATADVPQSQPSNEKTGEKIAEPPLDETALDESRTNGHSRFYGAPAVSEKRWQEPQRLPDLFDKHAAGSSAQKQRLRFNPYLDIKDKEEPFKGGEVKLTIPID